MATEWNTLTPAEAAAKFIFNDRYAYRSQLNVFKLGIDRLPLATICCHDLRKAVTIHA